MVRGFNFSGERFSLSFGDIVKRFHLSPTSSGFHLSDDAEKAECERNVSGF